MAALLDSFLDPLFGSTKLEDDEIERLNGQAMDRAMNFDAPDLSDINFERYNYLGDYKPETIDGSQFRDLDAALSSYSPVSGTAYDDIALDGSTRDAQLAALSKLGNIADAGGMTAVDEANINRGLNQSATQARGARDAVMSNMSARGMGGSGMELLAQMQANQAAQNMNNQNSLDIAGMAQSRALDAMLRQGEMAGNVRGQDFEMAARKADARDAINRFNSQNMLANSGSNADRVNSMGQYNQGRGVDIAQYNTGAVNQGGMYNQGARQGISSANTGLGNQQILQNKIQNPLQNFQTDAQVLGVKQDATRGAAQHEEEKAVRKDKRRSDMIGAAVKGGTAVAGAMV